MKIIQNIKYQYQLKLLEDLLKDNKYSEINSNLENYCNSNPTLGYNLLIKFIPQFLNITSEEKILNDNLVLINSFDKMDCDILLKFINFYFSKINFPKYEISSYQNELISAIKSIKKDKEIFPEDIFQNSIYYQSILTYLKSNVIQFLNNQFAFFSTTSNLNFTNIRLTRCYFLLIDHPYFVFQKLKERLQSKDIAMNEFLNSDNKPLSHEHDGIKLHTTRKDWSVYTNSWSDPNVANTLKGAILKKEEYYSNPEEFFGSIILHLRQSNFDIPLDYSLISEYISGISLKRDVETINLSNREKKAIRRYVEKVSNHFGFEL